jgi:hypothetical protein
MRPWPHSSGNERPSSPDGEVAFPWSGPLRVPDGSLVSPRFGHRPVTRLGWLIDLGPTLAGSSALTEVGAVAAALEQAGFDSVWVEDPPGPIEGAGDAKEALGFEAYSLLGALARCTRSMRLGALPSGVDRRGPASLAKIVTGIDVISAGRGVVTLAPGPLADPRELDRLAEAFQVCRAVLDDQHPGFAGTFFSIAGAINQPPPVQAGGVPLVVRLRTADVGWDKALSLAATFADAVVVDGGPEQVAVAANAVSGRVSGTEVIWTGSLPPSTDQAATTVAALVGQGATGCILTASGPGGATPTVGLGPALREVMEPTTAQVRP